MYWPCAPFLFSSVRSFWEHSEFKRPTRRHTDYPTVKAPEKETSPVFVFLNPLPREHLRVVGRGQGWGDKKIAKKFSSERFLGNPKHPHPAKHRFATLSDPPHRFGGEGNYAATMLGAATGV
jgi:hypothetical protein